MDRRDTFKSLLVGSIAGGLVLTACATDESKKKELNGSAENVYGRTAKEKARDAALTAEKFFTEHEMETVAVLCDLILPATATAASAGTAGVAEFIHFIVKDMDEHKIPVRGGLMWLDHQCMMRYDQDFIHCTSSNQVELIDAIAYPDKVAPEMEQGVAFFSRMRNLVVTGYYTTRIGLDELGYQGNIPNVWDGVPDDVLKKHGLSYEPEWLAKCIDQEKRLELAQWDEQGNLI